MTTDLVPNSVPEPIALPATDRVDQLDRPTLTAALGRTGHALSDQLLTAESAPPYARSTTSRSTSAPPSTGPGLGGEAPSGPDLAGHLPA